MYAIIKTGGKQYRVEQGQSLLVERLAASDGETVALQPLLLVDGEDVVDGGDLSSVNVEARVVAHERGPKLRVVKFKPKRGYKRRTGHRQELTRIEITSLGRKASRSRSRSRSRAGGAEASQAQEGTSGAAAAPGGAEGGQTEEGTSGAAAASRATTTEANDGA